ncbi:MAG TPA: YdiU family protein, partial [Hellea balneolensis]|nr:YdiU family protein [Hellea balneolensis]
RVLDRAPEFLPVMDIFGKPDYLDLPDTFYKHTLPTPVKNPELAAFNIDLAKSFGLSENWGKTHLQTLAGNTNPKNAYPIAMAYCGHQFGHFAGVLGDGRAILIGQAQDTDGRTHDIQLKGAGQTPYSRRGDGRATLGAVLRECLTSEAMAGLGIATTRSLAAIRTGEPVFRERVEPGAILVRTARSHIRVGTFEYAARLDAGDAVQDLTRYMIEHHFTDIKNTPTPERALLARVIKQQAHLIAQWMGVGFIHGVMNTDNMSIVGETIDYGPCAFLDTYQHDKVFSSIDHHGRYAYNNQASIALWNLTRFAETLLPVLAPAPKDAVKIAQTELGKFALQFSRAYTRIFAQKFGIDPQAATTPDFITTALQMLQDEGLDFTLFFHRLSLIACGESRTLFLDMFPQQETGEMWLKLWQRAKSKSAATMQSANPVYIARNHQVERAIQAAESGDLSVFTRLMRAFATPFTANAEFDDLQIPPRPEEEVTQTFCGT